MMLKTVLSISGKSGLYTLISQGKNMLIVESISADKKRFPIYSNEKITSLSDITIYVDNGEVPLKDVLTFIKEKENDGLISVDIKKATPEELRVYMEKVLPNFDKERVYINDMKKIFSWYNILMTNGITDFQVEGSNKAEDVKTE
jgi:hypothetical protein